jgi:methylated-DNA-[protein]-cysteine S-methyltransferase
MIIHHSRLSLKSPLGTLQITGTVHGICRVAFADTIESDAPDAPQSLRNCLQQMEEYFAGERRVFALPLVMHSTDFQQEVWEALLRIPFGETQTYGEIAAAVGHPGAARAVGNSARENPLAILVPCHRILPATGGVGEYASGPERKEWLLRHEGVL